MATLLTPIEILPNGGLNDGTEPVSIDIRESPDCENVRFRKNGIQKRDGVARYVNAAVDGVNPVTGIAQLEKGDGTAGQVAFAGAEAKRENAGAWTSVKGAVTLTSGADNLFRFTTLNNLLISTNNVDPIVKWAGGANNLAALGGGPPAKAKDVTDFFNYALYLNVEEGGVRLPARLRFSDLNNGEIYPAANFTDIINLGGQQGKGFGKIGDFLFAYLSRSIHRISYTGIDIAPFNVNQAVPNIGAVSGYGIAATEFGNFFLGVKGPYFFDGASKPEYIGKKVEKTWGLANINRLPFAAAVHNQRQNEIWFSFATGSSTQNDTTLVYDYVASKWSRFRGFAPNCYGYFPATRELDPVMGSYTSFVMGLNSGVYTDDGAAISAYANTKPIDFDRRGRVVHVRRIDFVTDKESDAEATLRVKTAYDLNPPSATEDVSIASTGATFEDDKGTSLFDDVEFATEGQAVSSMRPTGEGQWFQMQVGNARAGQAMNVASALAFVKGDAVAS